MQNQNEQEYLSEAVSCAQNRHFRAAIVLGWCATIDRIHRKIEETGFQCFNDKSKQMCNQTRGRYKRFSQNLSITNLSELRNVFDNNVIWVIEGLGWIDTNQHTRLRSCFDMRNHCAHPGEAPITEYNLLSFFSDIDVIVLSNEKFKL